MERKNKEREKLKYSREHIVNHRNIPCTKDREQPHTVFIQLEEQEVSTSPRRTSLEGSVYLRTTGHSTGAVSAKVMPEPAKLCRLDPQEAGARKNPSAMDNWSEDCEQAVGEPEEGPLLLDVNAKMHKAKTFGAVYAAM